MARPSPPPSFRRRLVGLFALSTMEREGPVHGYRVAERVAEVSEGSWLPSPGAIYPALRRLVDLGLATDRHVDRRRVYAITPAGRAVLRQFRRRGPNGARDRADGAALWAEVHGVSDLGAFYLDRLRADLARVEARLGAESPGAGPLRAALRLELAQALERLAAKPPVGARRPARRR